MLQSERKVRRIITHTRHTCPTTAHIPIWSSVKRENLVRKSHWKHGVQWWLRSSKRSLTKCSITMGQKLIILQFMRNTNSRWFQARVRLALNPRSLTMWPHQIKQGIDKLCKVIQRNSWSRRRWRARYLQIVAINQEVDKYSNFRIPLAMIYSATVVGTIVVGCRLQWQTRSLLKIVSCNHLRLSMIHKVLLLLQKWTI